MINIPKITKSLQINKSTRKSIIAHIYISAKRVLANGTWTKRMETTCVLIHQKPHPQLDFPHMWMRKPRQFWFLILHHVYDSSSAISRAGVHEWAPVSLCTSEVVWKILSIMCILLVLRDSGCHQFLKSVHFLKKNKRIYELVSIVGQLWPGPGPFLPRGTLAGVLAQQEAGWDPTASEGAYWDTRHLEDELCESVLIWGIWLLRCPSSSSK